MTTPIRLQVETILKSIMDPELNVSLWDLGLIYDLHITGGDVEVMMTLTSMGCPLFGTIEHDIEEQLRTITGVTHVRVELTFEPPWTIDRMTPEARALLGFVGE